MSQTADEIIQGMQQEMGQPAPEEPAAEPQEAPQAVAEEQPVPDDQPELSAEQRAIQSLGGRMLAGTYKTAEDLEQGYTELLNKFRERDQEIGQLRQMVQQRQMREQIPQRSNEDFEDWVVENPIQAAEQAWASGDKHAYERVMDIFFDENPKMAARYEQAKVLRVQQQRFEQQLNQAVQPFRETYQQQQQMNAWETFRSQNPDVDTMPDQMQAAVNILYQINPDLISPLQNGTREQQVSVFQTLYAVARGLPASEDAPPVAQPDNGADSGLIQRIGPVQQRVMQTAVASANTMPPGQSSGARVPDRHAAILEAMESEIANP